MPPIISIVMPVFNGSTTIIPAINSILNQTFNDFELIIIDDGSYDATSEIIDSFGDSRIKKISLNKNSGTAIAQNLGIDLALGKYIARMDADDLSFPTRLQKQYDFLERNPNIDLMSTGVIVFDEKTGAAKRKLPVHISHKKITSQPWRSFYLHHAAWMGKASWFKRHKYKVPVSPRSDDQELLTRTYYQSKFDALNEVLYAYRCGEYQINKVLPARAAIFKAQCKTFIKERKVLYITLALASFIAKVAIDFFRSNPIIDSYYQNKFLKSITKEDQKKLDELFVVNRCNF